MSKIFEALRQAEYTINNIDIAALVDEGPAQREIHTPIFPDAAVSPSNAQNNIRRATLHLSPSSPLAPFDARNPKAGEQYRILRTRIIQHPVQPRIILISSAAARDGKSTTAINLSFAFALRSNVTVLLVDADMRRDAIAPALGIDRSPGLAEYLMGACCLNDVTVQCEQLSNLHIIPAGSWHSNPCELLDSELWRSTCAELRDKYAVVLLDSPPTGTVADYDVLQSVADGVVLVLQPDNTKRQSALTALQSIPKAKLLGVVMNCLAGWFANDRDIYYPNRAFEGPP